MHHYFSITFKFHNLHLKKHLGNITLVNTTQFFCQAQKPFLLANFGALISEMPTIFPNTSSFVCTNFVKFTNFYNKCPNFIRLWWTLLSITVIFYVRKMIFEPPPPNDSLPREDQTPHTPGECSTFLCFLHFWVYF